MQGVECPPQRDSAFARSGKFLHSKRSLVDFNFCAGLYPVIYLLAFKGFSLWLQSSLTFAGRTAMLTGSSSADVGQFLPALVVLLQNAVEGMFPLENDGNDEEGESNVAVDAVHRTLIDMNSIMAAVLQDFHLQHSLILLPHNLGWWVLPRSTI